MGPSQPEVELEEVFDGDESKSLGEEREEKKDEAAEGNDSFAEFEETQVSIATRRQQRTEEWQRRRGVSPQAARGSTRGSISLSPHRGSMKGSIKVSRPSVLKRPKESDNFNAMNASCPAIVYDANHLGDSSSDHYDDNAADITAQMAQMVANQQETTQALQELSSTMKAFTMAHIKHEKESEEDSKNLLNVDRATVRLDGLEVYAVVSALTVATAIACFDVYGFDNSNTWLALFLNTIFLLVSGVGIIAGLHATLVFSLMTMYGRTAVGVSQDKAFVEFFVQTGRVRYRGFHTFRMSLYCFLIQVLFTITSKCSPLLRPIIVIITLASMSWVYSDTQEVIDKAGDILFNIKTPKRTDSDSSTLALARTLSSSQPESKKGRALSLTEQTLNVMRNQMPGPRRRRQEEQQSSSRSRSEHDLVSTNGRYSRRKGVARSKSGCQVYDVGVHESRPVVRRGGKKPGHIKET